jgi:hypothetical protein
VASYTNCAWKYTDYFCFLQAEVSGIILTESGQSEQMQAKNAHRSHSHHKLQDYTLLHYIIMRPATHLYKYSLLMTRLAMRNAAAALDLSTPAALPT